MTTRRVQMRSDGVNKTMVMDVRISQRAIFNLWVGFSLKCLDTYLLVYYPFTSIMDNESSYLGEDEVGTQSQRTLSKLYCEAIFLPQVWSTWVLLRFHIFTVLYMWNIVIDCVFSRCFFMPHDLRMIDYRDIEAGKCCCLWDKDSYKIKNASCLYQHILPIVG